MNHTEQVSMLKQSEIEENVGHIKSHLTVAHAAAQNISQRLHDFKRNEDVFELAGCEDAADGLSDLIFECIQVIWGCEKIFYEGK